MNISQHIFPRNCEFDTPTAVEGEGCFLIDSDGKRYLDASGGAAVSCLGHSDTYVRNAIIKQVEKLSFAHSAFFTNGPAETLALRLSELSPDGLDRVYLVSGGSEAIEASLKLARQYFLEIGQPERHRVISRRQSYHGNTLGALASGGNHWRRQQFEPLLIETNLIAPCYAYRDKKSLETDESYGLRVADELEKEILALGPETVMGFVAEPVVGATSGAVCAVPNYFKRIREICDKYGVLLILDEVMCGMGRTGTFFACEADDVTPDIAVIAKGLGAGYQAIGAMMCQEFIYSSIKSGSGFFQHGHTYLAHPVACAAACAVLKRIVDDRLLQNVSEKGKKLKKKLDSAFSQHPNIGDIRGRGLFVGMEIVANRETKAPFDPAINFAGRIKKNAMDVGLICYPSQGTIDGRRGDHILLAPPFIISDAEVDILVQKLSEAIDSTLKSLPLYAEIV